MKTKEEKRIARKILMESIHKADNGDKEAEKMALAIGKKMGINKARTGKRIKATYPNGQIIIFNSLRSTAKKTRKHPTTIRKYVELGIKDTEGIKYEFVK